MDKPNLTEKENNAMQIELSINVIKWIKISLSVIVFFGSVVSAILGLIFNTVYNVNLNQGIFQANFINHEAKDTNRKVVINDRFDGIDGEIKSLETDVKKLQQSVPFNVSEN